MTSRTRLLRDVPRFTPFTTFTPTLDQGGAVACSAAIGRSMRIGPLIIATVHLVASAAGAAGNSIAVGGLPTAGATANGGGLVFGSFNRSLPPNPSHLLAGIWLTGNSVVFVSGAAATGFFGVNPAVTLASGDMLDLTFVYEALL
jgi:hypothetical protein